MHINEYTAVRTKRVLLVPYEECHVPRYHEWMADETLQALTASEPLSLPSEYSMQKSWREDGDKLTFIICTQDTQSQSSDPPVSSKATLTSMIGDINLFLTPADEDPEEGCVGELEIMLAEPESRGRGLGREALLAFLWYISRHLEGILQEYAAHEGSPSPSVTTTSQEPSIVSASKELAGKKEEETQEKNEDLIPKSKMQLLQLTAKIGSTNTSSIALFSSVGFRKVWESPNYFGEVEFVFEGGLGTERIDTLGGEVKGWDCKEVVWSNDARTLGQ